MQETRYCVKTLEMPLRRYTPPPADLDKSFSKLETNIRNFSKCVDAMHTRLDKLEAAGTINRVRHLAPPAGVRVVIDAEGITASEW